MSTESNDRRDSLRVFVSYDRSQPDLLERVVRGMRRAGMAPVWDADIRAGTVFTKEIQKRIATAHAVVPLLTRSSIDKPWINQEIGFAAGINVPVVPLTFGPVPRQMIADLQGVPVRRDLSDLGEALKRVRAGVLASTTQPASNVEFAFQIADFSEDRTKCLVELARDAPRPARIRQRAIFSSFSLPDALPSDSVWDIIEMERQRSDNFRALLRAERRILEEHARSAGCSLLLRPFLDYKPVGARVHRQQLELLSDFLQSMPVSKVRVAIADTSEHGNLTLVGDWFGARALPPRPASELRDTLLSQHGPTVLRWLRQFDDDLNAAFRVSKVDPEKSRDHALRRIERRLKELRVAEQADAGPAAQG